MSITHRFVEANGVRFHLAEAGDGPPVLLLHGFPECWYSWRHTLPSLADAGYRAIAPDMRGYNLTDKPKRGYDIETLVDDVAGLIESAAGGGPVHLVGHDWGGVVAWQAASRRPDLLRSLTIMNAPHPSAFARYARRHPSQVLRSTYMLLFQVPRLPEWLLTRRGASGVASAFRRGARRPGAFTTADLDVYREAILRPGAATATLNYYRQAIRQGSRALPTSPVTVPTLVLWGRGDPALSAALNDGLDEWAPGVTVRYIDDCGHWTQQERPDVVHPELLAWLRARDAVPAGAVP